MIKYSFTDEVILVNGVPLTAFADGDDVIQGDRSEDAFTDVVGADGEMLVTQNANRSGFIVLRLLEGGASNAYLNGLFALQEKGTFAAVIITIVNKTSGNSIIGTKGYITKPAPVTKGVNAGALEWRIRVQDYDAVFASLEQL
jgi:hypothetical protein